MRKISKNILLFILLGIGRLAFGQDHLDNEELIYSFNTQNGKKVILCKDKDNKYIIYRFGHNSKVEFEFPDKSKSSWKDFKYSFYLRGGGIQNEGMDLNYIYFIHNNYKYIIYDTYYAIGNKLNIGIKIIDLKTNKITNIKGNTKTRIGTLVDFRENKVLEIGEELFD